MNLSLAHPPRALLNIQWTRYIQVSSLTLVLYDYLLTLPQEVELVWRGSHSRSWPRMLFFVARYACPIMLVINTFPLFYMNTTNDVSRAWLFFHGWTGYVLFGGVQVISQMRLWAMYRSEKLLIAMTILVAISLIGMGMVEGLGYTDLTVSAEPAPGLHICGPKHIRSYVWIFWVPPILVETVAIGLVIYKAMLFYRKDFIPKEAVGSRLMTSLVQHSVFYFVVVLGPYLANLIIWRHFSISAYEIAIPLTYALPSVAGNRMLLSLRSIFYSKHTLVPGRDGIIGLTVVNEERGLTVHTEEPLNEFDTFFGEASRS